MQKVTQNLIAQAVNLLALSPFPQPSLPLWNLVIVLPLYFSLTTSQWKNFHFALNQQQQQEQQNSSSSKKNNARTTRSSQSENIWAKSDSVKAAADQIVRQALWPSTHKLTSPHLTITWLIDSTIGGIGKWGVCEHWQLVTLVTTFSLAARFVFIFRTWRRRRRWWKAKHTVTVTTTTTTVAQCSGRQSDVHFTY